MANSMYNKQKFFYCLIVIFFYLFLAPSIFSQFSTNCLLEVRDVSENRLLFTLRISTGEKFTIKEIHSITNSPVYDTFIISDDFRIKAYESSFVNSGSGGPTPTIEDDFILEKDTMRIRYLNNPIYFDEILLRVAYYNEHLFIFRDSLINLQDFSKKGNLVRIKIKN